MKRLLFLIAVACLFLFAFVVCSDAQTDNTFFVKQFFRSGLSVGDAVTAAQAACNADTSITCRIVFDPTLRSYRQGLFPAKCTQCVWERWDLIGGPQYGSGFTGVRFADQFANLAAAIGDLPATGGTIYLPPGTYTQALGSFAVSKPIRFICSDPKNTIIQFTGASGVAFLFNYDSNAPTGSYTDWGAGIENCRIIGPGTIDGGASNAGTGLQLGDTTHSSIGAQFKNVTIAGFALGTTWGEGAAGVTSWGTKFDHVTWLNNNQQMLWAGTGAAGLGSIECVHCNFNHYQAGVTVQANAVRFTGSSNGWFKFIDPYFQSDQLVVDSSYVSLINPIFENTNGRSTIPYVVQTAGTVSMFSPEFLQDFGSAGTVPTSFVSVSGGYMGIYDWRGYNSASGSTFPFLARSGSAEVTLVGVRGEANISAELTGSSTGKLTWFDGFGRLTISGGISTGSAGVANKALCWKDTTHIGYCSTQPTASGDCTCN